MAFDAHKNLAYSTVATAPSPATSGTSLTVQSGDGTKFPTPPFNATIWPTGAKPTTTNAEIVRVTNISTDTFTIIRIEESTSARSVVIGDQIAATITAKTITDIESGNTAWLTAAQMINGIVLARQGGTTGAASWVTGGTSNTTTSATNVMIQVGSVTTSASANTTITFPIAYNQIPTVFAQSQASIGIGAVDSVSTTTFLINNWTTGNARQAVITTWIAIGQ